MLGVDSCESVLVLCLSTAERVRSRLSDLFDGVTRIACMSSVVVSTVTTLTIGYAPKAKCSPTKIHNSLLRSEIFPRCDHHLILWNAVIRLGIAPIVGSRLSEAGDVSLERNCGMVTKCLNPPCGAPFQYLRSGKLFLVNSRDSRGGRIDVRHRGTEYFWLCDSCAAKMTLNLKGLNPEVIPLPNGTEDFLSEQYRGRMSLGRNSESERGATVSPTRRSA